MCGRYSLAPRQALTERFAVESAPPDLQARYNVAPTQVQPVVTQAEQRKIEQMRWGLVPFWAKDTKIGSKMINARAETIDSKPAFRRLLSSRRCLVPVTGFYEWKASAGGKIPHYIFLRDSDTFAFAGLYDTWKDADGSLLRSYTIITTAPNQLMQTIHNRMPVILPRAAEARWLDPALTDTAALLALLQPYPAEQMDAYPVSTAINRPGVDGAALIEPLPSTAPIIL